MQALVEHEDPAPRKMKRCRQSGRHSGGMAALAGYLFCYMRKFTSSAPCKPFCTPDEGEKRRRLHLIQKRKSSQRKSCSLLNELLEVY